MSLVVERVVGLCSIQGLGSRGRMHEAVPPGGALVPELLVIANRNVRNTDDACAIEVLGSIVVRATSDVLVATDRTASFVLRAGSELAVKSEPMRCAYLAVRGGFDSPAALLCAGGRRLEKGDSLSTGNAVESIAPPGTFTPSETIHVIPGPDLDAFAEGALEVLVSAPYRIEPSSDRVGTRLTGPPLPRRADYQERSRPMVIGALEVPRDSHPIVLGCEHPTTGGYPILAVVAHAELGRFFSIRLGGNVSFAITSRP
jgi:allophanate hydrolase subunit 2